MTFLQEVVRDGRIDTTARLHLDASATADERAMAEILNALLGRVQSDLRKLAHVSNDMSTGAVRNAALLNQIAAGAREQSEQTAQLAVAVQQTAESAASVAQNTSASRGLVSSMRERSIGSFSTVEASLAALAEIETGARQSSELISALADHSGRIEMLIEVIDDISAATNLLGINAAIEAAHAGDAGRGFSVVADEIKKLADSTKKSTKEIAQTIRDVREAVDTAFKTARENARRAQAVSNDATRVRDDLHAITNLIAQSTDQVSAVASAVEEQSAGLRQIASTVKTVSVHAESGAKKSEQATNLKLGTLNAVAFDVLQHYRMGIFFDQVCDQANAAAREMEAILERAVARGTLTMDDLFDANYIELRGSDVKRLARLFDVSRVGPEGFDPPKYRTRWDAALDDDFMELADRYADNEKRLDTIALSDRNAFVTMSVRKNRAAWTGDRARDLANNRLKRFFEDETGMRAARVGLTGAERVPKRAGRPAFVKAGVSLARPPGARPLLMQSYARDTGIVFNDLSAPVYVRGEHWGSIRFIYDPSVES